MRDFFERQDTARRNTFLLFVQFLGAVATVVTLVSVTLYILFTYNSSRLKRSPAEWDLKVLGTIAAVTLFLIICGTLYKYYRLRSGGGDMIATMLGGRIILPDTTDHHERRLINIVEEMAIASGVTVPSVYLLEKERGINAFAAGLDQEEAVIGVTWGALHYLNRDELQGVIAHEFSHILSGDMLINVRLQGLLHGILVLGLLGRVILRGGSRSRGRGSGGAFAIGLVLITFGYAGVFVGQILKSAISRQREFLADAAAVQFTRNPQGLAGALKKIGGVVSGSEIKNPHAEEISHMYFGNGMASNWFGLLSTHPPLQQRIERLDPEFRGSFPEQVKPVSIGQEEALAYATATAAQPEFIPADVHVDREGLVDAVENPTPVQLQKARMLIDSIPETVRDTARNPFGARAVIYALLIDQKQQIRDRQLTLLEKEEDSRVVKEFRQLLTDVLWLNSGLRLPLVDLTLSALKILSSNQYMDFRKIIKALVEIDGEIDLFEYCLWIILTKNLDKHFGKKQKNDPPIKSLEKVREEISCVLSNLCRYGHDSEKEARRAMMKALRHFDERQRKYFIYIAAADSSLTDFNHALIKLNRCSMPIKDQLLSAVLECITWDNKITTREAELYRVISESLELPIPPWLTTGGIETNSPQ